MKPLYRIAVGETARDVAAAMPQRRNAATDVIPINQMVIGKDGGNGDRQTFGIGKPGDALPTISTSHHHCVAYAITL